MDLQHLLVFTEVARQGSVSRAAARLNSTQPTVSRQIAALEAFVGFELIRRTANRMRLTPAGTSFFATACRLIQELDKGMSDVRNMSTPGTVIRIGANSALMYSFVAEAIQAFLHEHPDIEVEFIDGSPAQQMKMLENGPLDLAIVDRIRMPRAHSERLSRVPLILYTSAVNKRPLAIEGQLLQLRNEVFLLPSNDAFPQASNWLWDLREIYGSVPKTREVKGIETLLSRVSLGHGVAILPAHFSLSPVPGLRFESLPYVGMESDVSALTRPGTRSSPVRKLIEILKRSATTRYATKFWQPGPRACEAAFESNGVAGRRKNATDRRKENRSRADLISR